MWNEGFACLFFGTCWDVGLISVYWIFLFPYLQIIPETPPRKHFQHLQPVMLRGTAKLHGTLMHDSHFVPAHSSTSSSAKASHLTCRFEIRSSPIKTKQNCCFNDNEENPHHQKPWPLLSRVNGNTTANSHIWASKSGQNHTCLRCMPVLEVPAFQLSEQTKPSPFPMPKPGTMPNRPYRFYYQ